MDSLLSGGLIALIGFAVGAYFRGRFTKTGEIDAMNSRLDDIVKQAEAMTQATKTIETEIARMDWTGRELMTLRRTKLEELLRAVYAADDHVAAKASAALLGNPLPTDNSMRVAKVLSALYFHELTLPVAQFAMKYYSAQGVIATLDLAVKQRDHVFAIAKLNNVLPSEAEIAASWKAIKDASDESTRIYNKELQPQTAIIESAAGVLINKIVGQKIGDDTDYSAAFARLFDPPATADGNINKPRDPV